MAKIFDLVTSPAIATYWETLSQNEAPYLGEELFPNEKQLGLDLKWIKGANGAPVALKPSAYNVSAIPRGRIGFSEVKTSMPFFKESLYVDEELRQQLNIVMQSGSAAYQDAILNRVFSDQMALLRGARAQRERMRMSLLTTGAIAIAANGQNYTYDYGMPNTHKKSALTSWSDPTADIVGDIMAWQTVIEDDTGVRPTRAVCDRKTWGYMLANAAIKSSMFVLSNGGVAITDNELISYLKNRLGISIVVYSKAYVNEAATLTRFVPDNTFVLFPEGTLGSTWFGTTPEESDLLGGSEADVTITDTGVAVTTSRKVDPVNVETKVSMICLPSFETINQLLIADVIADVVIVPLGDLDVTTAAGTEEIGDSVITVAPATPTTGNKFVYKLGTAYVEFAYDDTLITGWTEFNSGATLAGGANSKVTVAEVTAAGKARSRGIAVLTKKLT